MKNLRTQLIIIIMLFAFVSVADAQSKSDEMYNAFSGKDGITEFSLSKSMLDMIDLDLGDKNDKKVTGDLHRVRFMSYNPEEGEFSGREFSDKAISLLPPRYKKYENDNDEFSDSEVEIYLLGKKRKFSECHIFVKNDDPGNLQFVISFYGDFTVNDIEGLKNAGGDIVN